MDTLQVVTDSVRDLIRVGTFSASKLGDLHLDKGAVPRKWIDAFAHSTGVILANTRRQVAVLSKSSQDDDVAVFQESIEALMQEFQSASLRTALPTPAAASLLFHRIVTFLWSGFRDLAGISVTLGYGELAEQCLYVAKAIATPARRASPYSAPSAYGKYLQIFTDLSSAPDPMAQLLVLSEVASGDSFAPQRAALSRERARLEPYVGDGPALEISSPVIAAGIPDEDKAPADRTYRVWFGTNRALVKPADPAYGFSAEVDTQLHLGSCLVFVPRSHEEGSLGSSWIKRTFVLRADDRLRLESVRVLEREAFQKKVAGELAHRPKARSALVFVHGFNVSFEEAAVRAAQLACDLTVDGVTAFYSWPSVGGLSDYWHDEETVRVSTPRFLEFLETLLEINGLERADIIAHSMGNRLVASAMKEIAESAKHKRIGHLVLAAPDVARVEFTALAPDYAAVATKAVTLYSSARDRALKASSKVHKFVRIGYEPPIYVHDGIDTVSTTRIKVDFFGHGYFAAAKPLIVDLKKLLWADLRPAQRGLIVVPDEVTPEYWVLKAR
jgi:esterase/lipase superfamily enzyme